MAALYSNLYVIKCKKKSYLNCLSRTVGREENLRFKIIPGHSPRVPPLPPQMTNYPNHLLLWQRMIVKPKRRNVVRDYFLTMRPCFVPGQNCFLI